MSGKFDPEKVAVLRELVAQRIHSDFADPLKVFVKREPHKRAKIEDERFRLILAVSLVDAMVDRIAFGWLARNVLASRSTPVRIGFSLIDGGWREFRKKYLYRTVTAIDKSSWDWTVTEWLIEAMQSLVERLAEGCPQWQLELMRRRFDKLFRQAVFKFDDGTMVQQVGVGVMKSGCYLTIILNSMGQLLCHYLAAKEAGISPEGDMDILGDDTIQGEIDNLEGYLAAFQSLGVIVKAQTGSVIEFAGFIFTENTVEPAYTAKHMFKMSSCDQLAEMLTSYQHLYAKSPAMLAFVRDACRKTGNTKALLPLGKIDLYK